jgi:hypothetical protein
VESDKVTETEKSTAMPHEYTVDAFDHEIMVIMCVKDEVQDTMDYT